MAKGEREKISKGAFTIIGHRQDGSIITDDDAYIPKFIPGTQWRIKSHNAEQGGTNLLKEFFGSSRFTFPKSLYAVHDAIRFSLLISQMRLLLISLQDQVQRFMR